MVRFLLLPLSALAVGGDVTYKVNKQWFLFCFLLLRSAPGLLSSPWFSVLSFFRSQTWRLRKEGWRLEAGGGQIWDLWAPLCQAATGGSDSV